MAVRDYIMVVEVVRGAVKNCAAPPGRPVPLLVLPVPTKQQQQPPLLE